MQLPPWFTAALDRYERSRPGRALAWYGVRRGSVLCGGIAYAGLFSLFAALTIGYTAFMAVLGGNASLHQEVLEQIDAAVPGLLDTGSGGLIDPDSLLLSTGVTWAGIVAVVVLLFSALTCITALRVSVRTMFDDEDRGSENAVLGKLRDLGAFVLLAVSVVASSAATLAVSAFSRGLLDALGWEEAAPVAVRLAGVGVALVIDALTVVAIIVFLAGVRPRQRDLWIGALAAAGAVAVLRLLGTEIVTRSASRNALLASFAVFVTILLVVNLVARILLTVCAWMADPPRIERDEGERDEDEPAEVERGEDEAGEEAAAEVAGSGGAERAKQAPSVRRQEA